MARAKIETLTPEQIGRFGEFTERWTAIGLSTELADRPRAEAAVALMYEIAGLAPPRVVWCGSPLSMALTRAITLKHSDLPKAVWESVWASVRASVWASVRESVRESVGESVGESVRASVRASVGASVWESVGGQHEAGWLVFYRYFHDVLGLREETQRLDGLWEFAQSAGWAIPCRSVCFVAERHTTLHRDERGRLHCEDGPAVAYPDGWQIHAIHGVRVPGWIVEDPGRITVAAIEAERNSEIQRVMIERFGWDRYAAEAGAEVVDHDERWGTLRRRGEMLWLEVVNRSPEPDGSFRRYALALDADLRPIPDTEAGETEFGRPQKLTALNAVASTFGLTGAEYARRIGALAECES